MQETVEDTEVSNSERFNSIEETLQKDKQNRVYFSAYDDEGGDVTGQLKFPKITRLFILNLLLVEGWLLSFDKKTIIQRNISMKVCLSV